MIALNNRIKGANRSIFTGTGQGYLTGNPVTVNTVGVGLTGVEGWGWWG